MYVATSYAFVLAAMSTYITDFWRVTPCSLTAEYEGLRVSCCLHVRRSNPTNCIQQNKMDDEEKRGKKQM